MLPFQRAAERSVRRLWPHLQKGQRRYAGDSHGARQKHQQHGEQKHHASGNESLGTGFYICIAAIPASFALYSLTRQGADSQPYVTRWINHTYNQYAEKWQTRNDLHTQMMELAAADRVLFLSEANQEVRRVDLRFPEQFNMGAPWNVPAGHGSANIDAVIAKYEKEAFEENERKLKQLRENKVPCEQPFERLTKSPPATPGA